MPDRTCDPDMKAAREIGFSRVDRRRVIDEAIANNRLAGLELHPDDWADLDRFVDGEISIKELREIIKKRYPQKK